MLSWLSCFHIFTCFFYLMLFSTTWIVVWNNSNAGRCLRMESSHINHRSIIVINDLTVSTVVLNNSEAGWHLRMSPLILPLEALLLYYLTTTQPSWQLYWTTPKLTDARGQVLSYLYRIAGSSLPYQMVSLILVMPEDASSHCHSSKLYSPCM